MLPLRRDVALGFGSDQRPGQPQNSIGNACPPSVPWRAAFVCHRWPRILMSDRIVQAEARDRDGDGVRGCAGRRGTWTGHASNPPALCRVVGTRSPGAGKAFAPDLVATWAMVSAVLKGSGGRCPIISVPSALGADQADRARHLIVVRGSLTLMVVGPANASRGEERTRRTRMACKVARTRSVRADWDLEGR